ncbi:cytochrome P450 [Phaeosphaeriaceae sp. PMI808]|nr:cytochrome P450 [Phaeosphaeriaceae sp. PMI808]
MALLSYSLDGVSVLVVISWVLHRFLVLPHNPNEPPLIPSAIPIIGHVIGLLRYGNNYYSDIAKKCGKPIFTLGLPRARMYIVSSPELVTACDRRAKVISFAPYVVAFAERILAGGQESIHLLLEDLLEDRGASTLRPHTMNIMHQELVPGESLNELEHMVLENVLRSFDTMMANGNEVVVPMLRWIRSFVSMANTNAIYGPERNPMKDPEVMEGFWAVDKDFAMLGLKVLPNIIAPTGTRGREVFFEAFRKFYATESLPTASRLIKARYEVNTKYGVTAEDIAHFDLGVCTALLVNSVPAVWWTLYHAYSDEDLLAELRRGIEAAVTDKFQSLEHLNAKTASIPEIIKAFPLLESFVKEVLRIHSNSMSARLLLEDRVIEDGKGLSYLLKKGSFLAMPSGPVHASTAAWGSNALEFDPARFLKSGDKVPKASYRAFGGGSALCPGRHFAMMLILVRYDLVPVGGAWKVPETRFHISTSVMTPAKDFDIKIRPRENSRFADWDFVWESKRE